MSAPPRLVIDYGAVGTVAILAWPNGQWSALRFDEQHVLPSAAHIDHEGRIVTGHQAWSRADETTGTFTAAPLHVGTTAEPPGIGRELAQAMAAATLRRVADEATRMAGEPVNNVGLVVPARWGPRRRTWLRDAATQAGIPEPKLIDAPTAVAGLLPIMGVPLPDKADLLILDFGSGCEATVLRHISNDFDVLSTLHDPNAGGDAIDDLLLAHTSDSTAASTAVHVSSSSADPMSLTGPGERRWALLASVRAGKEVLSDRATATVGLPPPAPATILNTEMLRHTAHPVMQRAAELAEQAVEAADLDTEDLYGVYCIGGAAATPGLPEAITDRLNIIPATLPDPATSAALGGAAALNANTSAAPPAPAVGSFAALTAVIVPGAASLTLFIQFLLTTAPVGGSTFPDAVNWGELTLAALFAVLACLAAGPPLGTLVQHILRAQAPAQPATPTPDNQIRYGTTLAATIGLATTGVYAVLAALHTNLPLGSALRWAVLPAACTAAIAVTVTLATTRSNPGPEHTRPQAATFLKFSAGAAILVTTGMVLIQYTLTAPRPPDLVDYLDLGTRAGGLLIGVGVAFTLVKALLLRVVLAIPWGLLTAAIASPTTTGILATVFTLAVVCWCAFPFINLIAVTSRPRTPQADQAHSR